MELSPSVIGLAPVRLDAVVPCEVGKLDVLSAEADSFLGPQPAVVEDAEERDQLRPAGLLRPDGFEQRPGLSGIDHDCAGRPPRPSSAPAI